MKTLQISVSEGLRAYVEQQAARGGFGDISRYVEALIRDDQRRRAEASLRCELTKGEGEADAGPDEWTDIRDELQDLRGAR